MKAVSLFAGIGGFDLGFERAGIETTLQCEINPRRSEVLARHWPDVERHDDITTLERLPGCDVVTGGFPCQDVSVAGKRAGLAGERSGLWFEYARLLRESRPPWVVIENVPGLLHSNKGRDLGTILGTLGELGYGWAYRCLDGQFFGLAARRLRVFIVGSLGSRRAAEVLFEPGGVPRDSPPGREAGESAAIASLSGIGSGGPDDNDAQAGRLVVSHTLSAEGHTLDGASQHAVVAGTLSGGAHPGGFNGQAVDNLLITGAPRRLTPVEWERLQGFPDGWTAGLSDTQRYKALGDSVQVPVAEWIGRRITALPDLMRAIEGELR